MVVAHDPVNHPAHYTSSESGVECIEITQHLSFTLGNAVKYLWRAGKKEDELIDLRKARWYLDREYSLRLEFKQQAQTTAPDYEEWQVKFMSHIDTLESSDIRNCLIHCLLSVSPGQDKKDLYYALEFLENEIRRLERA